MTMSDLDKLNEVAEAIRAHLESVDQARDGAYRLQREVTRAAASTIRAVHRGELAEADELFAEAQRLCDTMNAHVAGQPEVSHTGFVMDAQKELAEAALVLSIVGDRELPSPASIRVEPAPYLNGLAEAAGELRRSTLDALKAKDFAEASRRLDAIDTIYHLLVTFDYPDAVAYGLKRRLDMVRGVLERTESDVMTTVREAELQAALERLEGKLKDG